MTEEKITIVISTVYPDKINKENFLKKSGLKRENIQFLIYDNKNQFSLTELYNKAIKESENNIILFMHDDVIINTYNWATKILNNHNENEEFSILGVAGSSYLSDNGMWWSYPCYRVGHVEHDNGEKKWMSNYSESRSNELLDVCVVDGLFFSINRQKIKKQFNEEYSGFHYYDISFCIENFLEGCRIGVFNNIDITHKSVGKLNDKWVINKDLFISKYKEILPISTDLDIVYDDSEVLIEKQPKLAIIIPTKENFHLLKQCVDSIFEKTSYSNFTIYIADTGSSEETKKEIKQYINGNSKIKLIEYDYYNFAKINNDVVRNKIDKDTELIIFSNNDIELINDSISIMVNTYLNKKDVGTIGCRLHYEDGRLQHNGILIAEQKNGNIVLTHRNLKYDFNSLKKEDDCIQIIGCTGGFLLINKELFNEIGGFNENYKRCFEDVELNLNCMFKRKNNYYCSNAVCYHFESQTRGENDVDRDDVLRIQSLIKEKILKK